MKDAKDANDFLNHYPLPTTHYPLLKIGILSDTHGTFDAKLFDFFAEVDELWHAGDIGGLELADRIAKFKPLVAVHGNIDDHRTRVVYRAFKSFKRENHTVLMTHIGNSLEAKQKIEIAKPTIYITGHSHILKVYNSNGILCINPGAAGHGYQGVRTAIRLQIEGSEIHSLEVIEL